MKHDYDILCIGLGPAGMAVAAMGSSMGLKTAAVEKHRIGGECMNVGCIPSKALLHVARAVHAVGEFGKLGLEAMHKPRVGNPFAGIRRNLDYLAEHKLGKMFGKVEVLTGVASFVDSHRVRVGDKIVVARKIFICSGSLPSVPDFPGLHDIPYLTNQNVFELDRVPASMIVIGGGAIACEMAQAFCRLGCRVSVIIRGKSVIWREGVEVAHELEKALIDDGVDILHEQTPVSFRMVDDKVEMVTDRGETIVAEKVLVAAGRKYDFSEMALERAGVHFSHDGIAVNRYLQTNCRHIYACGDCNGHATFSHAAMHQGMIALINCMAPWPFKKDFRRYVVPWTIFTDPEVSHVGQLESELIERGISYEVVETRYEDYGAAVAQGHERGFIRAMIGPKGQIYGVHIVGEGSGNMINEWALAIQRKIRISALLTLQHSFPTMGFLSKRVAETWMMKRMSDHMMQRFCRFMFRF